MCIERARLRLLPEIAAGISAIETEGRVSGTVLALRLSLMRTGS